MMSVRNQCGFIENQDFPGSISQMPTHLTYFQNQDGKCVVNLPPTNFKVCSEQESTPPRQSFVAYLQNHSCKCVIHLPPVSFKVRSEQASVWFIGPQHIPNWVQNKCRRLQGDRS